MTSKNEGSPKGPAKPTPEGGDVKKPSALLDLKATEVASKSAAGQPPAPAKADQGPLPGPAPKAAPAQDTKGAQPPLAGTATASTSKPEAATGGPPRQTPAGGGARQGEPERGPVSGPSRAGLGRVLTHVAAGVAGGFLALLLADAIGPRLGLGPALSPAVVGDLQDRLAAAEKAIKERPTSASAPSADVAQKLTALEGQVARLNDLNRTVAQMSETQARLAAEARTLEERFSQQRAGGGDMEQRVAKLEQMLATLTAAAGGEQPGGRIPQLAAITGKLADLESTIPNQLAELRRTMTQELEARLAQSAEASEAARSATLRMDRELSATRADVARLTQRAEALKASDERFEQTLRALQEEAGSLRSATDGLKSDLAAQLKTLARTQDLTAAVAPVDARLAAVEQGIQGVVRSEEDRRANAQRIVLALELGNLKRAIDRGGSYAAELAELGKVAGGKIDLAIMERYKDHGVPTFPELARDFRPVAYAIIDAATLPADASTFDRLLHSAKSIVRVRRTDHSLDDNSASAVVARMEKALADGRLTEVLSEARRLPPKSLEAAEPWLAKVEARAAVDRALAAVEEQLKASLSGRPVADKRTQ
jgi:hypothetical protein